MSEVMKPEYECLRSFGEQFATLPAHGPSIASRLRTRKVIGPLAVAALLVSGAAAGAELVNNGDSEAIPRQGVTLHFAADVVPNSCADGELLVDLVATTPTAPYVVSDVRCTYGADPGLTPRAERAVEQEALRETSAFGMPSGAAISGDE